MRDTQRGIETFATPGGESNRGGAVNWLLDGSGQSVPTCQEIASHSEGNRTGMSPHGGSRRVRKARDAQGTEGSHGAHCNDDITGAEMSYMRRGRNGTRQRGAWQ
jgi:hypothetical protein